MVGAPTVFCGIQDLKDKQSSPDGWASPSSQINDLMTSAIMSAAQAIRTVTRRSFDYGPYLETFATKERTWDMGGDRFSRRGLDQPFYLREKPVDLTVTPTVYYDGVSPNIQWAIANSSARLLTENQDFIMDCEGEERSRVRLCIPTDKSPSGLQITYTAGYQAAQDPYPGSTLQVLQAPYDLQEANAIHALFIYNRLANAAAPGREFAMSNRSVMAEEDARRSLVPEAMSLVRRYIYNLTGRR